MFISAFMSVRLTFKSDHNLMLAMSALPPIVLQNSR
jgi:hypothetical protein